MAREATLLLVFGGLGTASLLLARGEAPATAATSHHHADVAPPAPAAATVDLAPRPAAVTDHTRDLELPDGTFVPALNGATDAAPLSTYWGPFPWSPIAGIERADGVDWYRHEDGSYSTTQMVWRSDLGTQAAMTRVAHPGPAPAATR
ncbi:MAG: hypothetical protein U1E73_04125 [Planctomycetota bacterium]